MTNKLPTKRSVRFLLAEDVRQEIAGKFSLLGVFAGEKVIVGGTLPPGAPPQMAVALASLAFVFIVSGGEGRFAGRFRVNAPDGKTVLAETQFDSIELRSGQANTIASAARPFVGPAFGTYTAILEIDSAKFRFPFEVLKAPNSSRKK